MDINIWLVLMLMVEVHILADFHLQGIMADMKQRSWWAGFPERYKDDYIPVLALHGFEWSLLTMLPLLLLTWPAMGWWFPALVVVNATIHAYVDHRKANDLSMDLWADQSIHLAQIGVSFAIGVML